MDAPWRWWTKRESIFSCGSRNIIIEPVQPLFARGSFTGTRFVVFILLSLLLMALDHRAGYLDTARSALSTVVFPLRYVADLPARIFSWADANLTSRATLLAENDRLRRRHFRDRIKITRLTQLEAENERLRKLLRASEKVGEQVSVAELLSVDMDPFSRRVTLDRGARNGITLDYFLVDTEGIMGQVIEVGPFSSTALLITDPNHGLPVRMDRGGFRSIALGTGIGDLLELSYVPNDVEIHIGDTLLTSGLGGRFPAGYPVGTVVRIERDTEQMFARILIRPKARMERNREVLLVRPIPRIVAEEIRTGNAEKMETAAPDT
uniref:Cell shape-determining protein MreC n=1 Tax=Candidatus Kentrum sp. DK TaxID=2126562 RepID=A0A450RTH6_9GAMM|nr:MAG: rod shape-determining protein MreC [Candidatus Kentron sp. DK]